MSEFVKNKIKETYKKKSKNDKIRQKYAKMISKENQSNNIRLNYNLLVNEKVIYQIFKNLNSRICMELKRLNIERSFKYSNVLGCSINKFEQYLLFHMKEGMTFDNYGEWEVDHIIPFSHFDFNDSNDICKCCNYNNLQPLWKLENRQKSNKIN